MMPTTNSANETPFLDVRERQQRQWGTRRVARGEILQLQRTRRTGHERYRDAAPQREGSSR